MRDCVIDCIRKEKLILIARGVPQEKMLDVAQSLYDGGVRVMEITFDASGKTADESTAEQIAMLAKAFEGKMVIGAGTVLYEEQVMRARDAGARFIVSPDTCEAVIRKTRQLEMVSIPGAYTPSEVMTAWRAGADFVKLFPIVSMGAEYIKQLRAPISQVPFLAVGGVALSDVETYLKSGLAGVGLGSDIIRKPWVQEGAYDRIRAHAEAYVQTIRACK